MVQEWMWTPRGEIACGDCGARYQVMTSRIKKRRYGYARCELCDSVISEWIDTEARRHLRVSDADPEAVAAASPVKAAG